MVQLLRCIVVHCVSFLIHSSYSAVFLNPNKVNLQERFESSQRRSTRGAALKNKLPSQAALLGNSSRAASSNSDTDQFAWLEKVDGTDAMDWVKAQDKLTLSSLGDPALSPLFSRVRNILQSKKRIPFVTKIGKYLYTLWQDDLHIRGLWRRTTLDEYRKNTPAWETVLDVDALGKNEGESWVWKSFHFANLGSGEPLELVLLHLSRGGADATVVREFNLTSKAFVLAPQGFVLKEAKSDVNYLDRNTLLVGTSFGGNSATSSGYARTIRLWKRGTDLKNAQVFFEGKTTDVSVYAHRVHDRRGCVYDLRGRATSFYTSENFIRIVDGPGADADFRRLDLPEDASASTFATELIVQTRSIYSASPRHSFPAGSLVAIPVATFLRGEKSEWTELFVPDENTTMHGYAVTLNFIVVQVLNNVKSQLVVWKFGDDSKWIRQPLQTLGSGGVSKIADLKVWALDGHDSDALWVQESGFLRPTTLSLAPSAATLQRAEKLKSLPNMFNTTGLTVVQQWAVSSDGSRIPYFLVGKNGRGGQPTLLYGYGGFQIPQLPFYGAVMGSLWLERGGAFALANIRGGGEFGPKWHQAAVKENKYRSFEDFAAVARHLVSSGVTSPAHLGIMGGSNGGFLVGNMLVKYPNLFDAVVCQVPLLDMKRYNKLLAGASWMAEYGDPDKPKEWEFLRHNSPYHNVNSSVPYPAVLFITSTRDDRVHPSHARKMAAKMQMLGSESRNRTFFYENIEGGHGAAADAKQSALVSTLEYNFLWSRLHAPLSR